MAVGASTVNLANAMLNGVRNTSFAIAATYGKLHLGDPGASGTSSPSALTTRSQIIFSAASSGAIALSNSPSWVMSATETVTHLSVWDASSGGNFLWSAQLTTSKAVTSGDTLNLNSCGLAVTPLAA